MPDWEFRHHGEDLPVTEACQFNESDHNYLSRRWEAAGWHYAYEHTANGHKLVLGDDSTLAEAIDGVEIAFQRHAGSQEEDGIHEWSAERRIVPARVTLTSYDFKSPWPKTVEVPTRNNQGLVLRKEAYEYAGAYGFKDRQDGDHLATQRMEEFEQAGKFFEAAGNNRNVLPGRWFRLTGHFDGGSKEECEFLIVDTHHPDDYAGLVDDWLADTELEGIDVFHVIARSAFGKLYVCGEQTGRSVSMSRHSHSRGSTLKSGLTRQTLNSDGATQVITQVRNDSGQDSLD